MVGKLEISCLFKHNIIYKKKKIEMARKTLFAIGFLLIPVACLGLLGVSGNLGFGEYKDAIYSTYNPIYSPYVEMGGIIFVNGTGYSLKNTNDLEFGLIMNAENKVVNNQIEFVASENILINAPENGLVSDIGVTNDGIKYITIIHSKDIKSVIENIDISAVKVGQMVNKNQEIATAIMGEKIILRLYKNDKQLTNLTIENNKILWKE